MPDPSLFQQNAQNWRKVTLLDDTMIVESSVNETAELTTLKYDDLGTIKPDYFYFNSHEYAHPLTYRRTRAVLLGIATIVCIVITSVLYSAGYDTASNYTLVMAFATLILALFSPFYKRSVRLKSISFSASNTNLNLYVRNKQDEDLVDALCKSYQEKLYARLLTVLDEWISDHHNETAILHLLNYIHENDGMTDESYKTYLKKLKAEKH